MLVGLKRLEEKINSSDKQAHIFIENDVDYSPLANFTFINDNFTNDEKIKVLIHYTIAVAI